MRIVTLTGDSEAGYHVCVNAKLTPLLTFQGLDALQPGEPPDLLAADGEDLVTLHNPAPAAAGPGRGALGAAALDVEPPDRLTGAAAALEPEAKPELLPRPPGYGDVLLGEVTGVLLLQTLDGDVPRGGGETSNI